MLAARRLRTGARTLRLGYNLLFLDTDVVIFDDPYKFLKAPPFKDKHLMLSGGRAAHVFIN